MRQDYLVRSDMPHVSDDFMYIFGFKIINQIELVLESYCLVIELVIESHPGEVSASGCKAGMHVIY